MEPELFKWSKFSVNEEKRWPRSLVAWETRPTAAFCGSGLPASNLLPCATGSRKQNRKLSQALGLGTGNRGPPCLERTAGRRQKGIYG